jgi:hypothetical protein
VKAWIGIKLDTVACLHDNAGDDPARKKEKTMPTKQPVPPPKNKFSAASDFERGVTFALFRRGGLDESNPMWMDGYRWGSDFKDSLHAARQLSLESHGYQPLGLISTQQQIPTSVPPPRKR